MISSRVSATTYFLPSIRVTTESGVASMRSIRSEFSTNTDPESRVSVIMERTFLVRWNPGRPWPYVHAHRLVPGRLEDLAQARAQQAGRSRTRYSATP